MSEGFDITSLNLLDEPVEGLAEAYENWEPDSEFPPPPGPGRKSAVISQIRDVRLNAEGRLSQVTLDFECKGGEYDGRLITFQRLWANLRARYGSGPVTSDLLDMLKSSGIEGVPSSDKSTMEMVQHLQDTGRVVNFSTDLEAYCKDCADAARMTETQTDTAEAAKEAMTALRQSDAAEAKRIQKLVDKAGYKAKNARGVPKNGDGAYPAEFDCPDCKATLRVRPFIRLWLAPSAGGDEI